MFLIFGRLVRCYKIANIAKMGTTAKIVKMAKMAKTTKIAKIAATAKTKKTAKKAKSIKIALGRANSNNLLAFLKTRIRGGRAVIFYNFFPEQQLNLLLIFHGFLDFTATITHQILLDFCNLF